MIVVNKKKMNIFSILLFCGISLISLLIQTKIHKETYVEPNFTIILLIISFLFIHEGLHYIAFIVFGKLNPNQIIIKSNKSSILPYVRIESEITVRKFNQALLFPTLILGIFTLYLVLNNRNILYSYLLGYAISIGTGDILLVIEMLKLDKNTLVVSSEETFGMEVKK